MLIIFGWSLCYRSVICQRMQHRSPRAAVKRCILSCCMMISSTSSFSAEMVVAEDFARRFFAFFTDGCLAPPLAAGAPRFWPRALLAGAGSSLLVAAKPGLLLWLDDLMLQAPR